MFQKKVALAFIIICVLCKLNAALAQTNSNVFEYHKNAPAYVHVIEKGQTLFSISKKYNVTVSEIENFNDGIGNGLQPQKSIFIPIKSTSINHTIEKGETLFSIAKKYHSTKSKIVADNLLKDENVKVGQTLKIVFSKKENSAEPETTKQNSETKMPENVTANAVTNDASSNNALTDNINSKVIVALLLPFYLDKNNLDEELIGDELEEAKQPPVFTKSYAALDFYEGLKLACDSFVSNPKFEIMVIDCPNDTFAVQNILLGKDIKKANIIIGPFNSNYAPFVADYCKKNKKISCMPFGQQGKILLNNEYAFKASSSNTTQLESVAKYVNSKYKNMQCLVVHNGLKKEKNLVDAFKLKYNLLSNDSAKTILFKELKLAGVKTKLSTTKENIIVVCSNDQAFVTDFVNKIYTLKDDYKLTVFGTEQWQEYENLELAVIQDLNLHVPSNYYINYDDSLTKNFIKKYRAEYYTEPSRASFLGFDLMQMIIANSHSAINIENLCNTKFNGLHIKFDFVKTSHESGFENTYTPILQYKDYMLKAVEK